MKNKSTSSLLIYLPIGLGDHLRYHGIVREYCKKYGRVGIFSVPRFYPSVSFMYRDIKNLTIIKGAYKKGEYTFAKKFIFLNKLKIGKYRYDEIKILQNNSLKKDSEITFEEQIYRLAGIDFSKKWSSFFVARDLSREREIFKQFAPKGDYVFVHEDAYRNMTINRDKINKNYAIFPSNEKMIDNIFDYCTIIEKAKEVHVIDSSFMFLVDCLRYKNKDQKLFIHRYSRENDEYLLPVLRKKWDILTSTKTSIKFSIVTIINNGTEFLWETIESVLSQEGDFFIDYIVAGSSNDGSLEIVKKYRNILKNGSYPIKCKDIKLIWRTKQEMNISSSINDVLRESGGEISSWINTGDFYETNAFQIVLKKIVEDRGIDLLYGDIYMHNDNGDKKLEQSKKTDFNDLLKKENIIWKSSTFFTKRALQKVDFLDVNLHYAMDLDLWVKIAKNGKIFYLPNPLSNSRITGKQVSDLFRNNFLKEKKILLWKHGGGIISPELIQRVKSRNLVLKYINKKMPRLYSYCKRKIYDAISTSHY